VRLYDIDGIATAEPLLGPDGHGQVDSFRGQLLQPGFQGGALRATGSGAFRHPPRQIRIPGGPERDVHADSVAVSHQLPLEVPADTVQQLDLELLGPLARFHRGLPGIVDQLAVVRAEGGGRCRTRTASR
jgi:hypothetical protein